MGRDLHRCLEEKLRVVWPFTALMPRRFPPPSFDSQAATDCAWRVFGGIAAAPCAAWSQIAHGMGANISGGVQALLPVFANSASIVLNTSINAHLGMPNSSIYPATKAALLSFARTFSGELISRGIRVNAVSPRADFDALSPQAGANGC